MSLNNIVTANTLYTDDRRLSVKFANIDAGGDITGQNILQRQYQQLASTAKTGTGSNSLINTSQAKGSVTIPANTLRQGSKIYISSYGRFTYGNGLDFNFHFRFNGVRYIVNSSYTTSSAYLTGSVYKIEQIIHIGQVTLTSGQAKVFTKINIQNPNPFTDDYFLNIDNNYLLDTAIDNTFDLEGVFNSAGGTMILDDLEMNVII